MLDGENVHLSAEVVHQRAQERLPEISLATVYNTLNELVAMGEVLEISAAAGPKRYDPNVRHAHHHLVCTRCGLLQDVQPEGTSSLLLPEDRRHGFEVTGVDVVFRGLCPSCAADERDGAHATMGDAPLAVTS